MRSAWRTLSDSGHRNIYPSREEFDQKKYLSALYKNVSFHDLEKGAKTLEQKVKQRTEGLRSLVAQNLDAFISCKDTIDSNLCSSPPQFQLSFDVSFCVCGGM